MLISLTSQASGCISLAPYSKSAFLLLHCTCRKVLGTYQLGLEGNTWSLFPCFLSVMSPHQEHTTFQKRALLQGIVSWTVFFSRGVLSFVIKPHLLRNGDVEIQRQQKISRKLSYSPFHPTLTISRCLNKSSFWREPSREAQSFICEAFHSPRWKTRLNISAGAHGKSYDIMPLWQIKCVIWFIKEPTETGREDF